MYKPIVFNDAYDTYDDYSFNSPYFLSTINTPFRSHVSSLGTAVNTVAVKKLSVPVLSPVLSPSLNLSVESDDLKLSVPLIPAPPPIVTNNIVEYENLNNDPVLIKKVTKYFFEKTMNSWLYSDFEDLLSYLIVDKNKVKVISNKNEIKKNKKDNNIKTIEMKVNFIADYVMTKYDMKSFLKKYSLKSGLDLWKLKENKSYVKKSIYKKIKSKLKKLAFLN
tara:strand:+ start:19 stop:681 length:663 start_codon:yes stop_codon:yes gene_type:complete